MVLVCREALVKLANSNNVKLVWAPGHRGIQGNKRADRLAKREGGDAGTVPVRSNPVTNGFTNRLFEEKSHSRFSKMWLEVKEEIQLQKNITEGSRSFIKPFSETVKVHQVRGNVITNEKLSMKSLSCFCSNFCSHFHLGEITYPHNDPAKLDAAEIYTDYDDDIHKICLPRNIRNSDVAVDDNHSDNMPSCPKPAEDVNSNDKNGDFVHVQYHNKKNEYRYAGV
ncbi:hypothetical protein PV327_006175 [Microctonus hyperodae]|uniref:RNase H type-1 domain-containing protein n=1 Tax=Microctonus hyperodae TaxID=165561 RepID=A0AA39F3S6_MICHY|nr:hypothetical protein PV327_006175 [Microctonus hyperodae]